MTCRHQELACAAGLDLLGADEAREFALHLPDCPNCREEVETARLLLDALAFSAAAPAPRPALRRTILHRARASRLRMPAPVAAVLLVVLLLAALWLGATRFPVLPAVTRTASGYIIASLDPTAMSPHAKGEVMLLPEADHILVMADGLAPLQRGRVYEAWLLTRGGAHPLGPLHLDSWGYAWLHARVPPTTFRGLLVSVEPARPGPTPSASTVLATSGDAK